MIRVEVEGKVVGGGPDAGAGRVFIESSAQVTLEELIRLTVQEQVRELLAHRQLSADDVEAKLASQYQTVEEIRRLRQAIARRLSGRHELRILILRTSSARHSTPSARVAIWYSSMTDSSRSSPTKSSLMPIRTCN